MNNFIGWEQPKRNYSKLPHQFINNLPEFSSLSEMCVVIYVLRHTWGFDDEYKKITMDEFRNGRKRKDGTRIDNGTGLSLNAIRHGIKTAVKHGFLFVTEDNKDKARVKRYYSLTDSRGSDHEPLNVNPRHSDHEPLCSEVEPRTEKETIRKKLLERKDIAASAAPPPPPMPNANGNHAINGNSGKSPTPPVPASPPSQTDLDTAVAQMLEAWARLFPGKSQPRTGTYRSKIKARLKDSEFRELWLEAMERSAKSPSCQKESWFRFEFFIRNDENWRQCYDRWMDWKDKKLNKPSANPIPAPASERVGGRW